VRSRALQRATYARYALVIPTLLPIDTSRALAMNAP
jgi:hypothetical protein